MPRIIELLFVLFVLLTALLLGAPPVGAPESCLSLQKARVRWPTAHLYWHGRDHCWDAKRRGSSRAGVLKRRPVEVTRRPPRVVPVNVVPADQFNEIDAKAPAEVSVPRIKMDPVAADLMQSEPAANWQTFTFAPWQRLIDGQSFMMPPWGRR